MDFKTHTFKNASWFSNSMEMFKCNRSSFEDKFDRLSNLTEFVCQEARAAEAAAAAAVWAGGLGGWLAGRGFSKDFQENAICKKSTKIHNLYLMCAITVN